MNQTTTMTENKPLDAVYFWRPTERPYGVFSNWAITPFHDPQSDIYFQSTEHYMMYYKAMLMEDPDMAKAIANTPTPKRARELGRKVRNWDEQKWVEHREQVMYDGILLKCRYHPQVAKLLINTNTKVIVEASPFDCIWGIGLRESDLRAKDPKKWKGKNLLGKSLMKVRENTVIVVN